MAEMRKTVIYLTPGQHERLYLLAYQERVSMTELIRRAIEQVYGPIEEPVEGKEKAA